MSALRNVIHAPINVLIAFACAVLIIMMVHITADVFAKFVLNAPIEGTIEVVSGYYMVMVVYFPFAYIAAGEGHIIVELFTRRLPMRTISRLDGVMGLITLVYIVILTWATVEEAAFQTARLELWETGTQNIPIWPSRWFVPIGSGAMAIYVICRAADDLRGRKKEAPERS